jgi:iron complex outermembrane receptor protein
MTILRRFDEFRDGCDPCSYLGNYDGPGANPKRKGLFGATWQQGPWTLAGQMNYLGAYQYWVVGFAAPGATQDQPRVASYSTFDAQVAYTGIKDMQIRLGVRNLTDRDPRPLAYYPAGTDSSLYDPRGRFMYTSVNYKFK